MSSREPNVIYGSKVRSNAYRSSNSLIISGPSTMYNEITRPRSSTKQYHENTNSYAVTAPYIKTRKSIPKTRINKRLS